SMNRSLVILNILLALGLGLFFVSSFKGEGGGPEQRVRSLDLNKKFSFCGENFPTDNFDVHQRLDAELLRNVYFHSQTILAIERAHAIFPIIEPILKEEGVPEDLKYLAVAESALSNAVSPVGARGVWQFMKSAAEEYGLEVNDEVDERYHLEKSTHAACKFLKAQKDKLGTWVLASAAYNGGPERIMQEMSKQRAKSFFDLNLAADETMRYPFRIMAIKEVMEHPEDYEYFIDSEHMYAPLTDYKVVKITGSVPSWGEFAQVQGTSYRMLKLYNPWLIDGKLTNKAGKTYEIRVRK
ncbi:MAG: lytic transglycosylase domain-containing protein, partial [Bacteroidetes bacterium]|nr:lytic transglycosylase domain-containing protein [Bacteroidota bacterium]